MSEAPRLRLHRLIRELRAGALKTRDFCAPQFERAYNLQLDKATLSAAEAAAFEALFQEVAWFSPFPEDRAQYPGHRDETDIARAAEIAVQRLSRV